MLLSLFCGALMLEFTEYTKFLIGLLAIVNPLGAAPIFVALTSGTSVAERNKIAKTVVVAVMIILFTTLLFGDWLLEFFGITIHSFSVGSWESSLGSGLLRVV